MESSSMPSYIHIFKCKNKSSSQRTQLASVAHIAESTAMTARQKRNHVQKRRRKLASIQANYTPVIVPPDILKNIITEKEIKEQVIVFDGGDKNNIPITHPDIEHWRPIRISDGKHLHVVKSDDPNKGLIHSAQNGVADFILLPRSQAMKTIPDRPITDLFKAIKACETAKGSPLQRGTSKTTFGDDVTRPPKYTSVGVQPNRNKPGVTRVQPFMHRLETDQWDQIMKMMRWSEKAFEMMADHTVLHQIEAAKRAVQFETIQPSPNDPKQTSGKYYGAIAFGRNLFLRCHTDQDYAYSMIQVHLEGSDSYSLDDQVVTYFCFPTLGIAIALRPGDFLLFNATIPHSISSRCRNDSNVISVSSYLKTAVVGLNNNSIPLSEDQKKLLDTFKLSRRHTRVQKNEIKKTNKRKHK